MASTRFVAVLILGGILPGTGCRPSSLPLQPPPSADQAEAREIQARQAAGLVFYGASWMTPRDADVLREADRTAVGWDVRVRVDTPCVTIYSGQPLGFTRRLADLLGNERSLYEQLYGQVWKLRPPPGAFRVYLFGDRETYLRVAAPAYGRPIEDTATGFYSVDTRILYVGITLSQSQGAYNPENAVWNAVHEMTHAMDHQLAHCLRRQPIWLAEGRADYFGYAVLGRRVVPGAVRIPADDARAMTLEEALPGARLSELMGMGVEPFCEVGVLEHYALAWAWVHFLLHGEGGRHAEAFRRFLSGMPALSVADFERTVGRVPELDPAFRAYVRDELLPAAKGPPR